MSLGHYLLSFSWSCRRELPDTFLYSQYIPKRPHLVPGPRHGVRQEPSLLWGKDPDSLPFYSLPASPSLSPTRWETEGSCTRRTSLSIRLDPHRAVSTGETFCVGSFRHSTSVSDNSRNAPSAYTGTVNPLLPRRVVPRYGATSDKFRGGRTRTARLCLKPASLFD